MNAELVEEGDPRSALLRDLGVMRDLITDWLESERLAEGHKALQVAPVAVVALLRELVTAQFAGQTLRLDLDETLGPWPLDATRIRLLMRNLIDNALRHGANVTQPPEVFARRSGAQLLLGVRDHGGGVAPEHLMRLSEA